MPDSNGHRQETTATAAPEVRPVLVPLRPFWLVAFCLALLAPWALVAALFLHRQAPDVAVPTPAPAQDGPAGVTLSKVGPWGQLQYMPLVIAPPAESIEELGGSAQPSPWHFPNTTREQLEWLLTAAGLPPAERTRLTNLSQPEPAAHGLVLQPTVEITRGLPAAARGKLYLFLSRFSANSDQHNAFRLPVADVDDWLADTKLKPEVLQVVKNLLYTNGRFSFLADLPCVLPLVKDQDERVRLLKVLARRRTMLIRLVVPQGADVRALADYWGRGGRKKDLESLLDSLNDIPGGAAIDINHLLPGFARRRIYTYPPSSTEPGAENRGSHWTSLNFFSENPDDRYLNREEALKAFDRDFVPLYGDLQLGDLVLYVRGDAGVVHSAIYIADDIIFTKNGGRLTTPWVFMRLDDIQDFYPGDEPLKQVYRRRKEPAP